MNGDGPITTVVLDQPFGRVDGDITSSVIVVAWQLDSGLEASLAKLAQIVSSQTEVLVVGNGVDVSAHTARLESAGVTGRTLMLAENHGPSPARNEAAGRATGELLLFLDDDALPQPGWVHAHQQAHEQVGIQGVRGKLIADRSRFLTRLARSYDLGDSPRRAVLNTEGNMSVKAEAFREVGGFAPIFGHEGVELSARMIERYGSDSISYTPDAVIKHDYVASFLGYLAKRFRHGGVLRRLDLGQIRMAAAIRRPWTRWDLLLTPLRVAGGVAELAGVVWSIRRRR